MPIVEDGGSGNGGSRPFIDDTETGVVVNRAGGFVSSWETFDLEEPGVGFGRMLVTAANADGLTWATDVAPYLSVAVSSDGVTWLVLYGETGSPSAAVVLLDLAASASAAPVGLANAYSLFTPRFIRFRAFMLDPNTGVLYAGASNPTFTFTFHYTAS